MPSITVVPRSSTRHEPGVLNPLPSLLHTPSGLAMLELQGSVLSEDGAGVFVALQLGSLVFPAADGDDGGAWDEKRVSLFIGKHQRMTGEAKKLSKPLAVLRRKPESDTISSVDDVEIAEIVYYKIFFTHRPEPVGTAQYVVEK